MIHRPWNGDFIQTTTMTEEEPKTRQDRRASKRRAEKSRMKKHGKGLSKVYLDALRKRRGEK